MAECKSLPAADRQSIESDRKRRVSSVEFRFVYQRHFCRTDSDINDSTVRAYNDSPGSLRKSKIVRREIFRFPGLGVLLDSSRFPPVSFEAEDSTSLPG